MTARVKKFLIKKSNTVKQAMQLLGKAGEKQLFVIEDGDKLFGALSDGDIRKWILRNGSLDEKVDQICNKSPYQIDENYELSKVSQEMLTRRIEAVPVVDIAGRVKDILTWEGIFGGKVKKHRDHLDTQVVIMAGGQGSRLDPFTRVLPKPLIPMGDKPIIEAIMDRFHEYGIKEFYVSVNYKARLIKSYFYKFDGPYAIRYIEEEKPLGTVGSLKLIEHKLRSTFMVTNCDVLVDIDYAEFLRFHKEMEADLTLAVSFKHYVIPYGVCEIEKGGHLKSITEKPESNLLINTGIYVMSKKVVSLIPAGKKFDFNELVMKIKAKKMRVAVFPVSEKSWVDVGQWEEYFKAIAVGKE